MKVFSYRLNSSATVPVHSLSNDPILLINSAADQGCLYRILLFIHPGSRIQQQQQRGAGGDFLVPHYFSFEQVQNFVYQFTKKFSTFYPENCH